MLIKPVARPFLSRFGYRNVMIFDTLVIGLSFSITALLRAGTPILAVVAVLFLGGFLRSLQVTAVNTLIFSALPPNQLSKASGFASTVQQVCDSVGVAACGVILGQTAHTALAGASSSTGSVSLCVFFLAAVNLCALPLYLRLSHDAGDEMRGR